MPGFAPPRAAFYLLFTASGFAGLIYESIWTHYLKLLLGQGQPRGIHMPPELLQVLSAGLQSIIDIEIPHGTC